MSNDTVDVTQPDDQVELEQPVSNLIVKGGRTLTESPEAQHL